MAKQQRDITDIGKIAGSVGKARGLAKTDAERRANAPRILNPGDLQGSNLDAITVLNTTLGMPKGQSRSLTVDDLAAFRQNIRTLGTRFTGGITARQVVDMSQTVDRDRARKEILIAVPANAKAIRGAGRELDSLEVMFITNASQQSKDKRHFVTVQFLGYPVAIASGEKTPTKAANLMRKQAVRFDCDCGRHTFWYRYIATIGNYNVGRSENGYPKVRNPNLAGVACKHVLRVMAEIEGGAAVLNFLTRAITKGRDSANGAANVRGRQKDADKLALKQSKRSTTSTNTGDRDFDRARAALRKQSRATTARPTKVASGSKRIAALAGDPKVEKVLIGVIQEQGVSRDKAIAILNALARVGKS